jgi:gliding motility-associated-like protein
VYQNNAQVFFQNNVSLQGNWSYQWLFGDGADTTVNNKNLIGHYYDTVGKFPVTLYTQTNQGCKDSVTKYVTVLHVAPIAEFDLLDVNNAIKDTVKGCRPVTVHVNNKTQFADNFFWDFGNGVFYPVKNPPAVTYFNPGEYTIRLIARNAAGADTAIRTKVVKVYDLPIAAFRVNPEEIILPDKPVYTDNISIGGDNFYWNFGDGSAWKEGFEPEHIYQDTGTYTITMVAETRYGCLDTTDVQAQRKVKVRKGWAIAVPNAFTPAGSQVAQSEGLNDVFLPIVEGAIEYKLQIFNRWGEILFESKDVNVGWNGFHRGVLCTQDVYAWKIVATFSDGTQLTRIGDVTLLR